MHAVVLAGGPGRRLRPYTAVLPKVLLPMDEQPVLHLTLQQLRAGGVRTVTIAAGPTADLIKAFVGTGDAYGLDIRFHREAAPLGTAGALAALPALDEPVLVLAGAILTDLDYAEVMRRHAGALTVVTTRRDVHIPLGVLRFEHPPDPDRVTAYDEKPVYRVESPAGIFVCSPRALDHVGAGEVLDLPALVQRLIDAGEDVRAIRSGALSLDLGQFRDYDRALAEYRRLEPYLRGEVAAGRFG